MTEALYGLDAAERQRVADLRDEGRYFWLDASLSDTTRADLIETLAIPGRAARALETDEDVSTARRLHADDEAVVFGVRLFLGDEGAADDAAYRFRAIEVRVVVTGDYLLTVHEERVALPVALGYDGVAERSKFYVVYSVLDAMLNSTSDALEEVELKLEAIAAASTDGAAGRPPRSTLREAGARLGMMRRWTAAEQAVFERVGVELEALPGFDADGGRYFDRLDQQSDRLLGAVDAAMNAMGMLLDLQLNERAYVLSVVGTIFVPLTFITGFFGMNFGWMVDHISTAIAFWLLGFGVPLTTAVVAWRMFVRRFAMDDGDAK